jgi:hypothetical protein
MEQFLIDNLWIVCLAIAWTLPWKGVALWKSARAKQSAWFVVLMIVNTLGLLEILYIFAFAPKPKK